MDKTPRGRFAPSPSGRLHLGNMLSSLLAWLDIRSLGGQMLFRLEDLDPERSWDEYARLMAEDLRWLGLDWDEGPGVGGDCGPYLQSERRALYEDALQALKAQGKIYPCFCTRAQLQQQASAAPNLGDTQRVYAGTCAHLTQEEIERLSLARSPALRVRVPDEEVRFTDGVFGAYSENLARECGDFIIRRSDGVFAYQLAVVVDDALSGVTEVVRGADLLSSTPRQIWLHRLFGFAPPAFVHIPLLCDHDGRRLSKRDADLDLGVLRTRFSPAQLTGALAHAAGLIDRPEPVTPRELIPEFSWSKVPAGDLCLPAGFF